MAVHKAHELFHGHKDACELLRVAGVLGVVLRVAVHGRVRAPIPRRLDAHNFRTDSQFEATSAMLISACGGQGLTLPFVTSYGNDVAKLRLALDDGTQAL